MNVSLLIENCEFLKHSICRSDQLIDFSTAKANTGSYPNR